jgi:hypothetical protein
MIPSEEALTEGLNLDTPDGQVGLVLNSLQVLADLRTKIGERLGKHYDGNRKVYAEAGYPKTIEYKDYYARYLRQDLAGAIVDAYPDATWRDDPNLSDGNDDETTTFEADWLTIVRTQHLYHYVRRADVLANIGKFSVILLGLDDGAKLEEEPARRSGPEGLIYLQVYGYSNTKIRALETDVNSPRFGLPAEYTISMKRATGGTTETVVHWKRVIHVAEGLLENDYEGTPRLERVYNRMMDLEKTMAAAAEGFWRNAFPGLAAVKDPNYDWSKQTRDNIEQQFYHYFHQLSRLLKLEGVDVKELSAKVANPKAHVEAYLQLIAGATGIPVRVLTGSERGELASSQDSDNWNGRVDRRRATWAAPAVLLPMKDRFVDLGIVAEPLNPNAVKAEWPAVEATDKEQAEVAERRTKVLTSYASSPGVESVMTPRDFLVRIMGFDMDEAEDIIANAEQNQVEEEEETEEIMARTRVSAQLPPASPRNQPSEGAPVE